jgi:EpsI family protein
MIAGFAGRLRAIVRRDVQVDSRSLVTVLAALGAVLWLSWPTLASLHARWVDFGYSHGYLILVLSGWLALKALRRDPLAPLEPSIGGTGLLALAAVTVLTGHASTTVILAQAALPLLWFTAVWALLGFRNARRFFLPIAYLYFAIPLWDAINGGLQSLTVAVVSLWLRTADIPAFIDGNMIHIPAGSFEVAGGCSGLHYLVVGLALGAYLGLVGHERWSSRFALFGLALVTGLLANWLRVFAVIVAGHATDMQHFLIVRDHYYFGWALFLILCLGPLIVLDRRLPDTGFRAAVATIAPRLVRGRLGGAAAVIVVCLAAALVQWLAFRVAAETPTGITAPAVDGWNRVGDWDNAATPVFVGAAAVAAHRYTNGDTDLDVFVAGYARQVQGREVVYYANRPEGQAGRIVATKPVAVPRAGGAEMPWLEIEVADPGARSRLLWFGRRIGGRWANSNFVAKSYQIVGTLTGRPEALVVVLSAECGDHCESARARLAEFTEAIRPDFFGAAGG